MEAEEHRRHYYPGKTSITCSGHHIRQTEPTISVLISGYLLVMETRRPARPMLTVYPIILIQECLWPHLTRQSVEISGSITWPYAFKSLFNRLSSRCVSAYNIPLASHNSSNYQKAPIPAGRKKSYNIIIVRLSACQILPEWTAPAWCGTGSLFWGLHAPHSPAIHPDSTPV